MGNRYRIEPKKHEVNSQNFVSNTRKSCCSKTRSKPAEKVLFLQRTIGNQAVQRLMRAGTLQAKLRIGTPDDVFEQEADRVAEQVMRVPQPQAVSRGTPSIHRVCSKCEEGELKRQPIKEEEEEKKLQRKPGEEEEEKLQAKATSGSTPEVNPDIESNIQSLKGGGKPLSENERAFFEPRFGQDFGKVRVHVDAKAADSARSVDALAYTAGQDLVFGAGQYSPGTLAGKRLLAHELTHVVQQEASTHLQTTIQRANLTSPRLAGNALFENVLDNKDVIESGDTGPEVRRIQQLLIDLGFSLPTSGANGIFNAETVNAVKAFQISVPLPGDGRVGFRTINALDRAFPSVALPAGRSNPWTMACVLSMLCPWNRHLVTSVLPGYNIITFNSRTFPIETWNGATWVNSTFNSGGFRSGNNIGFLNTTCEDFAFTIYHEGWHAQQPSTLTGVVDVEKDAYINAEQWSIGMGISGQSFTNRVTGNAEDLRTISGGQTEVDETAAEALVRQTYGGISSIPGERILSRVGASNVGVRRPDGTEYTRAAQVNESVRGTAVMTNQNPINPADWVCP